MNLKKKEEPHIENFLKNTITQLKEENLLSDRMEEQYGSYRGQAGILLYSWDMLIQSGLNSVETYDNICVFEINKKGNTKTNLHPLASIAAESLKTDLLMLMLQDEKDEQNRANIRNCIADPI